MSDGSVIRLEFGAPAVINVWGSWCGPCRAEQPVLLRGASAHPEVRFLGLAVQDNDAASEAFRREFNVAYPSISDQSRERAARLGAVSTPATLAVDKGGVIRARVQGSVNLDTLDCMIRLASR